MKGYKDSIQLNRIRNEKGNITTQREEIKNKSSDFTTKAYSAKLGDLDEMDDFLDRYHIPKLNQGQVNYLNNAVLLRKVISLPTKTCPGSMVSVQNSIRPSKNSNPQTSRKK